MPACHKPHIANATCKGLSNSRVCVNQVLVGAASSPSPQSSAALQYTHTATPKALATPNINLMGWMQLITRVQQGQGELQVRRVRGHSPTPEGCSATDTGQGRAEQGDDSTKSCQQPSGHQAMAKQKSVARSSQAIHTIF